MNKTDLYEETITEMLHSLRSVADKLSASYNTAYDVFDSQPLFSVTAHTKELGLLKTVNAVFSKDIRDILAELCKKLTVEVGYQVVDHHETGDVDFYMIRDGEKIGYYFSMQELNMPTIDDAIKRGMSKHIVVVPKAKILDFPGNSKQYHSYPYKERTKCITLEEFFNTCVSAGEFEIFQEYIGRFNYEAETMLGLGVTPTPTQEAMQKKRSKVIEEFDNLFFRDCIPSTITVEKQDEIKRSLLESGILQIPGALFINSFVSSEWYFDLLERTAGGLEHTAIVAGYLKSIEQLLLTLVLSRQDLQLTLKTLGKSAPSKTLGKSAPSHDVLTINNLSSLLTTGGGILQSIDYNYTKKKKLFDVYLDSNIGDDVQKYLQDFFSNTRNCYFHKDNIYSLEQIKEIRKKAYCSFYLLGGTFRYNIDDVKSVISCVS